MNEFQILEGDALEVLRELPAESVDSMVTDPPAGISFMGKAWDQDHGGRREWCAGMEAIFAESLRVMKPGAHALVWAIPRTSHWTATALEDAGFEIRDVVVHLFGTGFPKSLDVSKAIDRAAGVEREETGLRTVDADKWTEPGRQALERGESSYEIPTTAPATPEAHRWQGYGTALKPAAEHWILCRVPLSGTVAANVIEHGCGGINVDGCRIENGARPLIESRNDDTKHAFGDGLNGSRHAGETTSGRWPANVVLSHTPECEAVGEKRVKGTGQFPASRRPTTFGAVGHGAGTEYRAGPVGLETIPDYRCAPGCPVAMLDEQSGELSSGGTPPSRPRDKTRFAYGALGGQENPDGIGGSQGTASRFFYCAKPSTAERNVGQTDNRHPTVKAAELMAYFCRMVTPAGGTVLDPFTGSGSTGIGALREGFDFIGIEREAEYAEIARHRIKGDAPLFNVDVCFFAGIDEAKAREWIDGCG